MKLHKKVLVDSSVWIDFFRGKSTPFMDQLVTEDLIITNELILSELIPALQKNKQRLIIESLLAVPVVPLETNWHLIRKMQTENLDNGINKVGIPDLIILQQVIDQKLHLHTSYKHFLLMQKVFEFSLV
ncbi:MAG: hypothetical protein RIM99_02345 [Cyclobacteriaceae bacterium]